MPLEAAEKNDAAAAVGSTPLYSGWSMVAVPECTTAAATASDCDDRPLVARIMNAYQQASSALSATADTPASLAETPLAETMWQQIFSGRHGSLDSLFRSRDVAAATKVLRDPGSTDLFYGFDNLILAMREAVQKPMGRAYYATLCLTNLVRLAEVIGAIKPFNPEQHDGNRHEHVCWDADTVLDRLDEALGVQLTYPNLFPNEVGLKTSRGVISDRVPHAIYQAWRLKHIVGDIQSPRIMELGAGLGRTAHFARQLGLFDYTIIDLPFTAISQGYFLGRTVGADSIVLTGELHGCRIGRLLPEERMIKIFDPPAFLQGKTRYDIVLNADSLTEMPSDVARTYLNQISSRAKAFLSINHENNPFSVRKLLAESEHTRDVLRHLYPLRQGYVEELVRF